MAAKFYIRRRGHEVEGPINAAQLRALAASGGLQRWDEVTRDMRLWTAAGKVKGLRFADAEPPPPGAASAGRPRPPAPTRHATPRRLEPERRAHDAEPATGREASGKARLAATRVLARIDRHPMGELRGRGCALALGVLGSVSAAIGSGLVGVFA